MRAVAWGLTVLYLALGLGISWHATYYWSGNHWITFGTAFDRWMVGHPQIVWALLAPLAAAAFCVALKRGGWAWVYGPAQVLASGMALNLAYAFIVD